MKRKKEKSANIWDKIVNLLWFFLIGFILFLCALILFSTKAHCAGNENETYFPMGQDDNSLISDTFVSYCENTYDSFNNDLLICYYNKDNNYYNVVVYVVPRSNAVLYAEVLSNGYQFQPYFSNISDNLSNTQVANNITLYWLDVRISDSAVWPVQSTVFQSNTFNSSLYANNCSYSSNFRLYKDNNKNAIVLNYGSDEPEIGTGHARPPEELQTPVYTQGHTKPDKVPPTYTVNNYSWTTYTPPNVDTSSLEKLLESLTDIVKYNATYLKDNLHNEFSNLINNIKGLIDYIGQTIQYYGNMLVETLNNLITTFYNNMVSIGEDITSKLTYIVSPLNTSALQTAIENTGIYNDYDRIFDMVGDAFGFYNDITEPNTFRIPIDLRNVTILHQTQIVYIDLGWLNSCKTIIRAFMWCVLTFGLLYTIIDSIPDYLNGNDE